MLDIMTNLVAPSQSVLLLFALLKQPVGDPAFD